MNTYIRILTAEFVRFNREGIVGLFKTQKN